MSSRIRSVERKIINLLPVSWQKRLAGSQANNRAILRSMIWLSVFVLGAKVIAALKEVVIAWRYGTSDVLDAYLLIFNLAGWPITLFGVVIGYVLIPELVRMRQGNTKVFEQWQRQITAWVWILSIAFTLVTAWGLPIILDRGWLGLNQPAQAAAKDLLPWITCMTGLGLVASWHAAQLMSAQRHANTFLEAMPSLALMVTVLFVSSSDVSPLLWGTVAGFLLQTFLIALAVRSAGMPILPLASSKPPLTSAIRSGAYWLIAAQTLLVGGGLIDQIILAHLSPGSLATFSYASRVMALILSLTALVLNRSLLPVLASITDANEAYELTRSWAKRIIWAGIIVAIGIALFSHLGIKLMFERGAFTASDTNEVAILLMLMSIQLPLHLGSTVWVQWVLTRPGHGPAMWWAAATGIVLKFSVIASLIVLFDWEASAVAMGFTASGIGYFWIIKRFVKKYKN